MSKNTGGGSAPKIPPTPEEQNEIRRAVKARRRTRPARYNGDTFIAGLEQDRLKKEMDYITEQLAERMTSSSLTAKMVIEQAFATFTKIYLSVGQDELRRMQQFRDRYALSKALALVNDPMISRYLSAEILAATKRLRRSSQLAHVG